MTKMKLIAASCAATAVLAIPALGAKTLDTPPLDIDLRALTDGEAKLAKMLEGRVAGDAQRCIRTPRNLDITVIDGTAIVYKVGRTLYVNVPKNARSLDDRDTMVRRTTMGNRWCSTDLVTTVDRHVGHYTGNINLGDFVPYRKAS